MSQFQTLIRSRDNPLNTQTLIFVAFVDATTSRWKMYLVQTRHKKFFCMLHFLKIATFLWIILILHPGHTSLLLETVIIKFGAPRRRGPTYEAEGRGSRKKNTHYYSNNKLKVIDNKNKI